MDHPDNPFTRFSVDLSGPALLERKKHLVERRDRLDERISRIVQEVTVSDIPILGHILGISHNKEELERAAKALSRLAVLISDRDDTAKKLETVELAETDPNFIAWAMGDFTNAFEEVDNADNP